MDLLHFEMLQKSIQTKTPQQVPGKCRYWRHPTGTTWGEQCCHLYVSGGLPKLSGVALSYVFAGLAGPGPDSRVEHSVEQADGPAEGAATQGEEADG